MCFLRSIANNKTRRFRYKSTSGKTIDGSFVLVGAAGVVEVTFDVDDVKVGAGVEVWLDGSTFGSVLTESSVSIGCIYDLNFMH